MKTSDYKEYLEGIFSDFESFLQNSRPKISSFHPYYKDALWEMVSNGGKRFRAKLFLSVVATHFYHKKEKLPPKFFTPALSLEVLHAYSLIHDDLPSMDNATLRRGCPTLHTKYDEAGAILVGDGLNTYAFLLLSQAKFKPKILISLVECLAKNAGISGMVLGQALDCYFENKKLSLEQLKTIHTNKTAKLIAAALQMGSIALGEKKKEQKRLYKMGLELGLLFQIRDDLIDATKSTQEAGKNTQNDTHKNSYVNLLGLDKAYKSAKRLESNIFDRLGSFPKPLANMILCTLEPYFNS